MVERSDTTGNRSEITIDPGRGRSSQAATPTGVDSDLSVIIRWYRFAQPPANCWHPYRDAQKAFTALPEEVERPVAFGKKSRLITSASYFFGGSSFIFTA